MRVSVRFVIRVRAMVRVNTTQSPNPKPIQPNSIVETCLSFCRSCIRPAWKTVKM